VAGSGGVCVWWESKSGVRRSVCIDGFDSRREDIFIFNALYKEIFINYVLST
jgi:hypothetical protein